MDVEREKTDQQPTAKGPQDKEDGGKRDKKGEYAEEPVIQKDKSTEQQATQHVPGIIEAGGVRGDKYSKTNPDINQSRVNANTQSVLEKTRKPAPITSYLQPLSIIENKKDTLTTHIDTDDELAEIKAKVAWKEKELKAANARFEILEHHFSSLSEELQGYYREDPAGIFDEIRERLEDIATAIRTSPLGLEVIDRNSCIQGEKPSVAESSKSVSFTDFPERREDFSTENSPEKADLSVFSKSANYASFERDECSSQPNPQLRELARRNLRQQNLILSKLERQQPVTSPPSRFRSLRIFPFVLPPTENRTISNIPLIFLYIANIVLFLTFLIAIAWALAAGFMADSERRMWQAGGETARVASVLLESEGGFWEKGWGPGAEGWGLDGDVEGLRMGYL